MQIDRENRVILEGIVSVQAALQARSRDIETVYVQRSKRSRSLSVLLRLAEASFVPVERVDEAAISERVSGKSHGGVIAVAGPRHYVSLSDLLAGVDRPFIAMLDGIEDPFNFGTAVRALYAAGAHGLVLRPRNWMSAAGVVARSSAGASELIPTAVADDVFDAAVFFKSRGLSIVCTTKEKSTSLYDVDLTIPIFLLIGGEKRGITRSFLDQADLRLEIPYGRPFPRSLGTASAVAVLAFEVMRQRTGTR
ncbi:MAG: RNA methyltransferase [Anaerolineae bacterium]|nr:RNA methyltransferase [Anaerolineae bacterium]